MFLGSDVAITSEQLAVPLERSRLSATAEPPAGLQLQPKRALICYSFSAGDHWDCPGFFIIALNI